MSATVDGAIDCIAGIVAAADGEIVGRTRLQKTVYLLSLAGADLGFSFNYKHYGPYSQDLADLVELAALSGRILEEKRPATWGGTYFVYRTTDTDSRLKQDPWLQMVGLAKQANAVELELAATAAFMKLEGADDPWEETTSRKPDKATAERLEGARQLYARLSQIETPRPLPVL